MSIQFLQGDCLEVLKTLPSESVNCVVTSPPYFNLRSYSGGDAEIGREETPDQYVAKMVEVMREVKRVMREDGVCWLNVGDSYAGYWGKNYAHKPFGDDRTADDSTPPNKESPNFASWGVKPTDMIGVPWSLAFALRTDGWYLRSACPWIKRNPMPESVKTRPATSIEYLFMFTKSGRDYYYNPDDVKKQCSTDMQRRAKKGHTRGGKGKVDESRCDADSIRGEHAKVIDTSKGRLRRSADWFFESWQGLMLDDMDGPLAFVVNTKPYKGAHFATFPPDLIRPCVLAGCPTGGTVLDPFGGSGTTGQVAKELGRDAILIELNPDYIKLARERCGESPVDNPPQSP